MLPHLPFKKNNTIIYTQVERNNALSNFSKAGIYSCHKNSFIRTIEIFRIRHNYGSNVMCKTISVTTYPVKQENLAEVAGLFA